MDDETGGKEGGGGDNPFSFKSFVKRASTDGGVKAVMKEGTGRGKKTRSAAAALPFPEEGGLICMQLGFRICIEYLYMYVYDTLCVVCTELSMCDINLRTLWE